MGDRILGGAAHFLLHLKKKNIFLFLPKFDRYDSYGPSSVLLLSRGSLDIRATEAAVQECELSRKPGWDCGDSDLLIISETKVDIFKSEYSLTIFCVFFYLGIKNRLNLFQLINDDKGH